MAEYKVLITTSGIGSRLGELTNYTNKCLVRVGKKPAISYIIECYPKKTEFVITCGYFGNQVKDFLNLAYPDYNFKFVEIDNFSGEGSSLGYSMLQAKVHLQCPFIFHAADTIVEKYQPDMNFNWIGYSKKENYSQYRTIDLINPKIFDKGHIGSDLAYIGLCGIKDFSQFWVSLEEVYSKDKLNSSLSDCDALNCFIGKDWKFHKYDNWLDIGNVSELNIARQKISDKFHILDKVDESIFIFEDFVIKFFYDKTICRNRVSRNEILGDLSPKIISSTDNFYKYKKVKGELLSDVITETLFYKLLEFSKENLWIQKEMNDIFLQNVYDFYFTKTKKRLKSFFEKNNISDEIEIINGYQIPKIETLLDKIDSDWICKSHPYQFHGDFILDNIILDEEQNFKLIDWRQDFAGDLENGDIYYDISKLNHNLLFNHDLISSGHFSIKIENNQIKFDILRSDNLTNCREILHNFISQNNLDLRKVKIITSLIWLNMSPLHEPKIGRLLFYLGKLNLYKALND